MKRTVSGKSASFCFCIVLTLPACTITDIAGNMDAGVGAGGALGTGGAVAVATGGAVAVATGGAVEVGTGGAVTGATGGAVAVATGGAVAVATGGAVEVATGGAVTVATGGVITGATGGAVAVATGGSTASSITLPTWATPDGCVTGNENSQFVGTWEGYIQGTPIGDEASSIRLNIVGANPTGLCGTVTIGTHTAPMTLPPATDAAVDYPPGWVPPSDCNRGPSKPPDHMLGLPYTIQNGKTDGLRTTFAISYAELYKSWCPLQTSYSNNLISGYNCLPNTGTMVSSGKCYVGSGGSDWQEVSCTQMCLCTGTSNVCTCGPQGCAANPSTSEFLFDLLINGNQAMGTFGSSNVVFNRVPVPSCVAAGQVCDSDSDCCSELCELGDGGAGVCQ